MTSIAFYLQYHSALMQILNYLMSNDYKHTSWWIILELDYHWWRCVRMLMSTPIQIIWSLDKWTPCWKKWFGYAVVVQSSTNPSNHSILSLLDREKSFAARTNWHYCHPPMHHYSGYDRTDIMACSKADEKSLWYSLFSTHQTIILELWKRYRENKERNVTTMCTTQCR